MDNSKKFLKEIVRLTGRNLKFRYIFLFASLLGLSLETIFAFSIPFSVEYFKNGHQRLAIFFLILTVSSQIIYAIFDVFQRNIEKKYTMFIDEESNKKTVDILGVVKNKVYVTEDKVRRRLNSVEIQENTKNYISKNIEFTDQIMRATIELVMFFVMFSGTIVATMLSVKDVRSLIVIMTVCIVAISLITIRQIKRREIFYCEKRQLNDTLNSQKMDLLNISPINHKHQCFLTDSYIESAATIKLKEIKITLKESIENCYKSGAMALSTVVLLLIAIFSYESLNMEIFASLMALSTLYSRMLNYLTHEISSIQKLIDASSEKKSYDKIMSVIATKYIEFSCDISDNHERITSIHLNNLDFVHEDTEKKTVHRIISDMLTFKSGATLIRGESGSGKSTLLKILSGIYSCDENILINNKFYKPCIYNYIMYDPDSSLGSKSILEEITFYNDKLNINKQKIIDILKGLNLFETITAKAKHEPILEYLSSVFKDSFSAGQLQRFVLARLLYNLDKNIDVVILDEPIANLDDDTATKVISFVNDFCSYDLARIVIIASHQVKLVEKFCDNKYGFNSISENYFKIESI